MPRFSAYPLFPTIAAARAKFRRHRNPTTFILEGSTSELKRVKCVDCGRPLSDFSGVDEDGKDLHPDGYRGNRCRAAANSTPPVRLKKRWHDMATAFLYRLDRNRNSNFVRAVTVDAATFDALEKNYRVTWCADNGLDDSHYLRSRKVIEMSSKCHRLNARNCSATTTRCSGAGACRPHSRPSQLRSTGGNKMAKPNLFNGGEEDVRQFVMAVTGLAMEDHRKSAPAKSGSQLLDLCAGECRRFHAKMATGIYNPVRRTLELMDGE